jgi:hypothetical protein
MIRNSWWPTDILLRMLSADERDAVSGDLVESGSTGTEAFRDVLGLIVRRQAALWSDWRPWLALVALVVPVGWALSGSCLRLGRAYDLYLWIIRDYDSIDTATLRETGLTLSAFIERLGRDSLLLIAWAWTAGFTLASLSRRTIWITGALLCLTVVFVVFAQAALNPRNRYDVAPPGTFSALFHLTGVLPWILMIILVLVPSLLGIRRGLRPFALPGAVTILAGAILFIGLAARSWFLSPSRNGLLFRFAAYWPVAYMIFAAFRQRFAVQIKGNET